MAHQLLLEIGMEEQPARFIEDSQAQLQVVMKDFLRQSRLSFGKIEGFSTPRRLAVMVYDLASQQEDLVEQVRGPAKRIAQDEEGGWTKAAEGFARGQGLTVDDIYFEDDQGEPYAYVERFTAGASAADILKDLGQVVKGLKFPVSMRWGRYEFDYIRPIHWITALLDDQVIPFSFLDIHSSNQLEGHRFLGQTIHLENAADYEEALEAQYVIADRDKRRELIRQQLQTIQADHQFVVDHDPALLDEVTDLVEYPTAFCGDFSPAYLSLPEEILITSMKDHQRYFSVRNSQGELLPHFVSVRNGNTDYLDQVIQGNEKVISARLDDAMFFYEEDQKISLQAYNDKLKDVSFYQGLGNMSQKVSRLKTIGQILGQELGLDDDQLAVVDRAAELSKFDLSTLMVNEFSELQGIMGGYYAKAAGEDDRVAQAIAEHYLPVSSQGALPSSVEGAVLSMADKLDNILMFFAVGQVPSGSNDPFALRRQAYGLLRILLDRSWTLPMVDLVDRIGRAISFPNEEIKLNFQKTEGDALQFIKNRIRQHLEKEGVDHDIISSVLFSLQDDLSQMIHTALLLDRVHHDSDHRQLVETLSRVVNLRAKAAEELKGQPQIDEGLWQTESEEALYDAYLKLKNLADRDLSAEDYYQALTTLENPINEFFDHNLVMHDDESIRHNRLSLLYALSHFILSFADLKKLTFK